MHRFHHHLASARRAAVRGPLLAARAALVASLALAACHAPDTLQPSPDPAAGSWTAQVPGTVGLVQTVRLYPTTPVTGDTVIVQSVIYNRSEIAIPVEIRECGLTLSGSLDRRDPFVHCMAYAASFDLAAGDSAGGTDRFIVTATPGRYDLVVQHLLNPAARVTVPVEVHAAH